MAIQKSVAGTAKDPTIQFATLTIDEQDYRLAFSFNAIAEAESMTGCNLLQGLQSLSSLSAAQLRGLFYAALKVAQPKTTVESAGALIKMDTMMQISLALIEAYNLSMPAKKNDQAEAEQS